jgi:hypothetical protein
MSDWIRLNGRNEMEEAHQIRSRLAVLHDMERHLAQTSVVKQRLASYIRKPELIETRFSPPRKTVVSH